MRSAVVRSRVKPGTTGNTAVHGDHHLADLAATINQRQRLRSLRQWQRGRHQRREPARGHEFEQ